MKKYKILFSGFAYVEADSAEEAKEKMEGDDIAYQELKTEPPIEIDDFVVEV